MVSLHCTQFLHCLTIMARRACETCATAERLVSFVTSCLFLENFSSLELLFVTKKKWCSHMRNFSKWYASFAFGVLINLSHQCVVSEDAYKPIWPMCSVRRCCCPTCWPNSTRRAIPARGCPQSMCELSRWSQWARYRVTTVLMRLPCLQLFVSNCSYFIE